MISGWMAVSLAYDGTNPVPWLTGFVFLSVGFAFLGAASATHSASTKALRSATKSNAWLFIPWLGFGFAGLAITMTTFVLAMAKPSTEASLNVPPLHRVSPESQVQAFVILAALILSVHAILRSKNIFSVPTTDSSHLVARPRHTAQHLGIFISASTVTGLLAALANTSWNTPPWDSAEYTSPWIFLAGMSVIPALGAISTKASVSFSRRTTRID